jgi:hypothetical protein
MRWQIKEQHEVKTNWVENLGSIALGFTVRKIISILKEVFKVVHVIIFLHIIQIFHYFFWIINFGCSSPVYAHNTIPGSHNFCLTFEFRYVWIDEMFLILGRISWNHIKEQKIETFQWWISVERFKILTYRSEMAK